MFVNWTTLKDENVNVRIGALGTDSLGASGLPAWVDNHFGQRFGGALLLSLLGDGLDILKTARNKQAQTAISPTKTHLTQQKKWQNNAGQYDKYSPRHILIRGLYCLLLFREISTFHPYMNFSNSVKQLI